MSEWISVKEKMPKDRENVKFLHDGYEFQGIFHNHASLLLDPLGEFPDWHFVGSQNGVGRVTTVKVSHWKPLEKQN